MSHQSTALTSGYTGRGPDTEGARAIIPGEEGPVAEDDRRGLRPPPKIGGHGRLRRASVQDHAVQDVYRHADVLSGQPDGPTRDGRGGRQADPGDSALERA